MKDAIHIGGSSIFFLVNSKTQVNLDEELVMIFGPAKDFQDKINSTYKRVNWEKNNNCTVISENGVLDFYLNEDGIIERFVMVDVKLTDEPFLEVSKLCKKYKWLLYDLVKEKYINISSHDNEP
jgi:hypothetical protein